MTTSSNAVAIVPCSSFTCLCRSASKLYGEVKVSGLGFGVERAFVRVSNPCCSRRTHVATLRYRLNAIDTRIVENAQTTATATVEIPVSCYQSKNPRTIAAKKVDALQEKLEAEIGLLKATIDERFNNVQQKFSSLEAMLLKLMELHLNPPPATSMGHGGVAGEGSVGTEHVCGFGSRQAGFGGDRSGGGISGERGSGYDRNAIGQGEFWARSSGLAETGVDLGGWRPLMAHNWAGLTQFGADSRVRKLKMPIFEGEDAYGWVYRVERYFAINGLSESEKTDGGGVMFGGKGPCVVSMARTTTTIKKFELLLGRLGGLPEVVLEGNFMKGLKPEIRASLRLLRPRGLGGSMELSQMIEDKNIVEWVNKSNSVDFSYRNSTPLVGQKTQTLGFQREMQSTPPRGQKMQMMGLQRDSQRDRVSVAQPGVTFKCLTETEIQDKRAKGCVFDAMRNFHRGIDGWRSYVLNGGYLWGVLSTLWENFFLIEIIGVPNQAEKDEIVKSVMDLKRAEIEEGYTMDAVMSRQDVLMDVRDKLLFEPEYAGNIRENIPPKPSLKIQWAWLPAALCLLQEVGEEKLVLDIGRAALQHPNAKPYVHDFLLSMALAECAIAKVAFEKNKVSQGFEALARAQCLLRSKVSLGNMPLLSQIEESLEELAPACTLELLGMPHSPENAERRRGAIAALRELIRQGLDVETSCRVQDWPCFLSRALNRLMAAEVVDLLPWDDLAITRKNKKSLESQNQRVVIDFNCFYIALIAHVALGFSSRQIELISKAKTICDCLIASESIDLKFEEAFCLFLLGQGTEAEAVEKLQQLELNSNPAMRSSFSGKEKKEISGAKPSVEMWLKDAVLSVFPDTQDCSPSLVNFFKGEKKTPAIKKCKGPPQTPLTMSQRPLSSALASDGRDFEDSHTSIKSSRHLGSAVKQLTPTDLQSPLVASKNSNGNNVSPSSAQLERGLGLQRSKVWESWLAGRNGIERIAFAAVLGCIMFLAVKLSGIRSNSVRNLSSSQQNMQMSSFVRTTDSSLDDSLGRTCIKRHGVASRLTELIKMVKLLFRNTSDTLYSQSSCLPASLSTSNIAVTQRPMPLEEAEALVKQWQAIKAEALGPNHEVHSLSEALDESMLVQWEALADAAKARSCYWRFVLLQLTIVQADIISHGGVGEIAEIEAVLEEAAELVDESQPKNPNYYSSYKIRYVLRKKDDGTWRFCKGDIQTPS
ncbi:Plastid division protein CDP1 [Citrus sinensis]|nr:Plastid division protein CDP1 [Citrus sinensis]